MRFILIIIGSGVFVLFCFCNSVYALLDDVLEADEELTFETLKLKGIEKGELIETVEDVLKPPAEEIEEIKEVKKEVPKKEREYRVSFLNRLDRYLKYLHPYVEIGGTVDDNIYLTHGDEKQDFITTVVQGGKYEIGGKPKRKTYILLDGGLETSYYGRSHRAGRYNPYANVALSHRFNRLSLNGIYTFKHDQIQRSQMEDTPVTKGDLINYYKSYYGAGAKLNLNRLIIEPQYTFTKLVYKKDDFKVPFSYTDHTAYLDLDIKILTKTYLLIDYRYTIRDIYKRHERIATAFTKDTHVGNYTHTKYWVGVEGKFFPKINGMVKWGFQKQDYEGGPNFKYYILNSILYYHPTKNLSFDLEFKRKNQESSRTGEETKDDTIVTIGCEYTPPILKNLSVDAEFSYSDYTYHSYRKDRLYKGTLSSEYKLTKWMKVVGEYTFDKRKSDEELLDEYQNNITTVKCVFEF